MKKRIFLLLLCVLAIVALVLTLSLCTQKKTEEAGNTLYASVKGHLENYPRLSSPYGFTKMYFNDGAYEYMLLQNGERKITAMRGDGEVISQFTKRIPASEENIGNKKPVGQNTDPKPDTVYFTDGKAWYLDSDSKLVYICDAADPVVPKLTDAVHGLLTEGITYSYHEASGGALPLWVYPGETYIACSRPSYPDTVEVMVLDEKDGSEYISWNIAYSSESVVLFLVAAEQREAPDTFLRGWGDLDEGIYKAVWDAE